MTKLTMIGAGNMAYAIASGLISRGFAAADITATDAVASQLDKFRALGSHGTDDNVAACSEADIILIAVKPDVVATVARELAAAGISAPCICVAAGITTTSLTDWLGHDQVVRCMPNTPALVQQGMMGLFATPACTTANRELTEQMLSAVGKTLWFEQEASLDAVTAVSGSGPAYFFYLMEAMQEAAVALGLSADDARLLVSQTALGAADMAAQEPDVAQLRKNVTSPGGTTAAALDVMSREDFKAIILAALKAANDRSIAMSRPV